MIEYGIMFQNGEETAIFGYDFQDACRRFKINKNLVKIVYVEFID